MSVTYVLRFAVEPARFEKLLSQVLDSMRHEPNSRAAVLHRNPGVPFDFPFV